MRFDELTARVEARLKEPLPGTAAQDRLSPRPRREWPPWLNPARIRNAAGLLLLFPVGEIAYTVLTVRSDRVRHGGQVSLPGGVVEPGETFTQAALREAHEEVGLAPDGVRILGALTPLDIPVSGFRLHPIVAVTPERPALAPADTEVARILEVSLGQLARRDAVSWRPFERDGQTYQVPGFTVDGAHVWGATAMVLAELLALAGWNPAEGE